MEPATLDDADDQHRMRWHKDEQPWRKNSLMTKANADADGKNPKGY